MQFSPYVKQTWQVLVHQFTSYGPKISLTQIAFSIKAPTAYSLMAHLAFALFAAGLFSVTTTWDQGYGVTTDLGKLIF